MKALQRARCGVVGHLSTTLRRKNPAKYLSQRHWLLHLAVPLMLSVKQENCEYQFKVICLTRIGIKPQYAGSEIIALSNRSPELSNL